ncbi:MAG: replicative DNA helicase [Sporolactobacillus sp.]
MQTVVKQDIDVENYVIGSIFLKPELMDDCSLRAQDFLSVRCRIVFEAFEHLQQEDQPINPVSVTNAIGDKKMQMIGGIGFISEIADYMPTTEDFEFYVQRVREAKMVNDSAELMRHALLDLTKETIAETAVSLEQLTADKEHQATSPVEELGDLYEFLITDQEELRGVTTGSIDLDRYTGGLQNGNLIVLAAQTSVGKTAFAANMAIAAAEKNTVVDFFETEMTRKELYQRFVSNRAELNMQEWLKNKHQITQHKLQVISGAMDHLLKLPLNVVEEPSLTINDIRAGIRKSLKEYPDNSHLVIIDYLQNMNSLSRYPNRRDLEVGEITKQLKQTARKFNVPIVLLSQLSRAVNSRDDKRPTKSDLRDSGNIEQDADIILFLYREKYYKHQSDNNEIQIIIAKQRNGMTGTVKMEADLKHQRFKNLAYA